MNITPVYAFHAAGMEAIPRSAPVAERALHFDTKYRNAVFHSMTGACLH